jgi:dihydropteroate synthase
MQMSRRLLLSLILTVISFHSARAETGPMMKAVVAHEYGAPKVLKFEEVPRPEPKENEVREKMKNDPWLKQGILKQDSIKRWQIFIDERS